MFTAAGFKTTLEYIELFKQGLICTVSLSALTVIFGFILALILAIMRLSSVCPFRFLALTSDGHLRDRGFLVTLSRFNPISFVATVYVEVFRATPMLVQLFLETVDELINLGSGHRVAESLIVAGQGIEKEKCKGDGNDA